MEEQNGDHKFFKEEKALEAKLDAFAGKLAAKRGYQEMPWALATKVVLLIYAVITFFAMFYRYDFMSITAIALGIYAVECPNYVKRQLFRVLVIFMAITWIFDIFHLLIFHDSNEDDEENGGATANVRRFAYLFAWLSFAFRPVVIIVFWKDSLDFFRLIR